MVRRYNVCGQDRVTKVFTKPLRKKSILELYILEDISSI